MTRIIDSNELIKKISFGYMRKKKPMIVDQPIQFFYKKISIKDFDKISIILLDKKVKLNGI